MPARLNYVNRNVSGFDCYYDGDSVRMHYREVGEIEIVPSTPTFLQSLKAWYRLDSNERDSFGTNHLTNSGVTFDGEAGNFASGGYLSGNALVTSGAMSISVWFNPTDTLVAPLVLQTVVGTAMGLSVGPAGDNITWYNRTFFGSPAGFGADVSIQSVWQHVVGVQDGSDIYIYHNGVEIGSGTSAPEYGATDLVIGLEGDLGDTFTGKIKQIGIWNRVITAGEVILLYNGGNPLDPTG